MRRTKKAGAFTLVELLVVIGIIALLISILMPALGRARMSANLLACQSNFRQVYNAIAFYANENKGLMPTAAERTDAGTDWGPSGTNAHIYVALSKYLGRTIDNSTTDKNETKVNLPAVFRCTEAPDVFASAVVWNPTVYRTMVFNPRGFPGSDQSGPDRNAGEQSNFGSRASWPQRQLASVHKAAEKAAFWDGSIILTWNMDPEPSRINLDGWRWGNGGWGHAYLEPPMNDAGGNESKRFDSPVDSGPNRDGAGWWDGGSIRFRHMKNTVTPVCFFDGHVESRKIGEIKVRDICINPAGNEKFLTNWNQ